MVFYMSSLQETQRCPLGEGPLGNDFPREARPLQGALPSGTSDPRRGFRVPQACRVGESQQGKRGGKARLLE